MVQQSGKPLLLLGPRRLAHAASPLGHACFALCRMRVWLGVVLLGLRPSLHWLRGSLIFSVRQLHRYYGAVRILQNVRVRIMDLSPSRTGLLAQTLWRPPGSRAHCLLTCLDSSTTPGPTATRDLMRLADVAFPLTEKGRHPVACFRSSMILPASPLSTLRCDPSRDHRQDSRPEWSRFSFSVGALIAYRFIPMLSVTKSHGLNRATSYSSPIAAKSLRVL